jgi:hypothetical protein
MDSLQVALVLSRGPSTDEVRSALPNAPVVPHVGAVPALGRSRRAVAGALHWAADVVAPAPARRTALR